MERGRVREMGEAFSGGKHKAGAAAERGAQRVLENLLWINNLVYLFIRFLSAGPMLQKQWGVWSLGLFQDDKVLGFYLLGDLARIRLNHIWLCWKVILGSAQGITSSAGDGTLVSFMNDKCLNPSTVSDLDFSFSR